MMSADAAALPVAVVDYGLGNLFSVLRACQAVGLNAVITSDPRRVLEAGAAIVPGVGAFGDAMQNLRRLGLADALTEYARGGRPLVGICLGLQLLMTESYEFGHHQGLGIVEGAVIRFDAPASAAGLKVPQIGWNRIQVAEPPAELAPHAWGDPLLLRIPNGAHMYFVHSFYAVPKRPEVVTSTAVYGNIRFCSSLRVGNVRGYQFHPERSGVNGLAIYRNLAALLNDSAQGAPAA